MPDLMAWFEDLGLRRDSPITKTVDNAQVQGAWVKTVKGQYVLGGDLAAAIIFYRGEVATSLGLLTAGQSGIVSNILYGQDTLSLFRQGAILSPGIQVEIIKYLPSVRYTVQAKNGREKEISLDAAAHVWGVSGEKHVQLAAVYMGETFIVKLFSSPGVKDRFLSWGMGKGVRLSLRRIDSVDSMIPYMEVEGTAQKILLPKGYADYIYVRVCEICWSCGACMVSGE